ncbi:MAG TPA: sialidase family protein [Usitatibacter sp.]|nr:sialidase family protein [Usitatibacter sp.]
MARMRLTLLLPLVVALCSCSGSGGGGGGTSTPALPVPPALGVVSGPSSFTGTCGGTGGTLYVNAEVEPHFAIDPGNADHWVGAWQQDRWSNGSARGVRVAATFDAGASWVLTTPAFGACAGGEFQRVTDPWIAFAADGTVYAIALGTTGGTFTQGSTNAIVVARSTDGGRTWSAPVTLIRDGPGFFNDKETLTADPADARFLYAAWDRLQQGAGGPAYFARTTDGGATWEPARAIFDPGHAAQTIGNLVRVLPNGTLVNVFLQIDGSEEQPISSRLRLVRSTDRGATWSGPVDIHEQHSLGTRDPATGTPVRDGAIVPQMAVGGDGTLHLVWQDARFTGVRDAIAYSRSTDGGLTWSAPRRVNGEPAVPAFTPQVHVRADGTVGVTYFDLRSDNADATTLFADYWLARSTDGVTWQETRVTAAFNLNTAPQAGGQYFLGDYMGLASAGDAFVPFYTRTTGDLANRTDVFWARIGSTTPAAPVPTEAKREVARDAQFARRVAANLAAALAARRQKE